MSECGFCNDTLTKIECCGCHKLYPMCNEYATSHVKCEQCDLVICKSCLQNNIAITVKCLTNKWCAQTPGTFVICSDCYKLYDNCKKCGKLLFDCYGCKHKSGNVIEWHNQSCQ